MLFVLFVGIADVVVGTIRYVVDCSVLNVIVVDVVVVTDDVVVTYVCYYSTLLVFVIL